MSALPDEGKSAEARKRVERRLTSLHDRYRAEVYAYCRRRLHNHEEAEDATQVTFAKAFAAFERGVVPRVEAAWLFTIAKRVVLTRLEKTDRLRAIEAVTEIDQLEAPAAADRSQVHELRRAVEALPEASRRAFVMREWQGLEYAEIADELGLQRNHVGVILLRARRQVVKQLRGVITFGPLSSAFQRAFEMLTANGEHLAAVTAVAVSAPILLAVAPKVTGSADAATRVERSSRLDATRPEPVRAVHFRGFVTRAPSPALPEPAAAPVAPALATAAVASAPIVTELQIDPAVPAAVSDPVPPAAEATEPTTSASAPPADAPASEPDPAGPRSTDTERAPVSEPDPSPVPVMGSESGTAATPPSGVQPGEGQATAATTPGQTSDDPSQSTGNRAADPGNGNANGHATPSAPDPAPAVTPPAPPRPACHASGRPAGQGQEEVAATPTSRSED